MYRELLSEGTLCGPILVRQTPRLTINHEMDEQFIRVFVFKILKKTKVINAKIYLFILFIYLHFPHKINITERK